MAVTTKKPGDQVRSVCPLFPEYEPPLYADDIARIRICRLGTTSSTNRNGKVPLRRDDYFIDGNENDIFVLDPHITTEEDLQEQFGGGTYWLDALRKTDGTIIGCGRRLIFEGPLKRGGVEIEENDSDDDVEDTRRPSAASPSAPPQDERVFTLLQNQIQAQERAAQAQLENEKSHSLKEKELFSTFAATMMKSSADQTKTAGPSSEMIEMMRDQINDVRKKAARDEEELHRRHREALAKQDQVVDEIKKAHRDETTRSDREVEEMRRNHRDEISRKDRELEETRRKAGTDVDETRRKMSTEEDEVRRRWRDDVSKMETRYERELTQARAEVIETRLKFQTEIDRVRKQFEDDLRDAKKENVELQRQKLLADGKVIAADGKIAASEAMAQAVRKAQPAPPEAESDQPWWMAAIQTQTGQELVGRVLENFLPSGAPRQPLSDPNYIPPQQPMVGSGEPFMIPPDQGFPDPAMFTQPPVMMEDPPIYPPSVTTAPSNQPVPVAQPVQPSQPARQGTAPGNDVSPFVFPQVHESQEPEQQTEEIPQVSSA
jgi:hypothetical protein